ncbi:hypothetical protein BKA70DRAFT_1522306 [Coprinopsis sp. MPI-PUGE-AT-0042]|nr:hypothetical protein BKA70DRAFT_1522306 [Coprinopsis sp. MPI-PUGE-AT-0042]
MLSPHDIPSQHASNDSVIPGQAHAQAVHLSGSNSGNDSMETGSQDLSAAFFAELLTGREFLNLPPLPLGNVFPLATQDVSSPENQPHAPASSYQTTDTTANGETDQETQAFGLRMVIEEQQSQLEELRRQIDCSDQRCAYYRGKAATFRALYSQQQGLSERIMSSLVHLRQSARQHEHANPPSSCCLTTSSASGRVQAIGGARVKSPPDCFDSPFGLFATSSGRRVIAIIPQYYHDYGTAMQVPASCHHFEDPYYESGVAVTADAIPVTGVVLEESQPTTSSISLPI